MKRTTLDDLVRDFETSYQSHLMIPENEVKFTLAKGRRAVVCMDIPEYLAKIVRDLIAITEPPKRKRAKAA